MMLWWTAVAWAVAATAAGSPAMDDRAVPTPPWLLADALPARPLAAATAPRLRACDFGAHAIAAQPLPMDHDPVFGRAAEPRRVALAAVLRDMEAANDLAGRAAAERRLVALYAGPEGARLARESLQQPAPWWRAAVMRAASPLAPHHPRLAGFLHEDAGHPDAALALAAMEFLLATRCDAAALYAADALRHRDRGVRTAAIDGLFAFAAAHGDLGIGGKLLARLQAEPEPALRVRIVRGWTWWALPGAGDVIARAETDRSEAVRAEALVLRRRAGGWHATDAPAQPPRQGPPLPRAAALRALALDASPAAIAALRAMQADTTEVRDAIDPRRLRLGAIAAALLQQLGAAR